jgi:hypothetical protein
MQQRALNGQPRSRGAQSAGRANQAHAYGLHKRNYSFILCPPRFDEEIFEHRWSLVPPQLNLFLRRLERRRGTHECVRHEFG